MKRLLLSATGLALLFLAACHSNDETNTQPEKRDSTYAIIGKVTGQDSGTIYIRHRKNGMIDSASLDHGYFKFNGKADTTEYCLLSLSNNKGAKDFFLENGKISMLIKKDSIESALISGTKTQDEFAYFESFYAKSIYDRNSTLDIAYRKAVEKKDKHVIDSLDKIYESLDNEFKQLITEYVKSHPGSTVSAFLVYGNFNYNPRVSQLDSLYHMLDTTVRAGYYGKLIVSTLATERLTGIGNAAPVFASDDVNGKEVSLSTTKGNYVLLDFWASWCGPCRRENPNVVKAFHKFHGKGFDIFGVSLDDDKSKWIAAIKKDGLDWTQVSDLKGWKADVVSLYGIKGIPMNYLLDKNGIIVAKGLRGDELDSKLAELLK
jgi:thiol-disulfide isomerase/thioredoxin